MSGEDRRRWDRKWEERLGLDVVPSWLVRHRSILTGGIAADLATGRGAVVHWLAEHGYQVLGIDISRVALLQAKTRDMTSGRTLYVQADLDTWRLPPASVDLVTVFRFLDRTLFASMRQALRPGGLLMCQTRTTGWLAHEPMASREYLLRGGELLRLADGLSIVSYLETASQAAIVARRMECPSQSAPADDLY